MCPCARVLLLQIKTRGTPHMIHRILSYTAAVVLMSFSTNAVNAQDEPEEEARSIIEEVVVTAEKREESEMTVPLAITAFDSFKIEKLKIENVNDLALMTPGLEVQTHATNNLFTMRGVGTAFSTAHLNESAVAVYQSGLAAMAGRTAGIDTDGFDIDRIEVLRGPQNTVYGRNGIGGTINYVRKAPKFEFGGELLSELGTSANRRIGLAVTGPVEAFGLGDSLAFRLTAHSNHRDGQQTNVGRTDLNRVCDVGTCTGAGLDSVDNWTISPQLEWRGETWTLNLLGGMYESDRLMGRNAPGLFPPGVLPAGLTFPNHINDGVNSRGVRRMASFYGWDAKIPTGDGGVQMNRDNTHMVESTNFVLTFEWELSDRFGLRYQTGVSDYSDLRHRDRDYTDRTGEPGFMDPDDPSVWPKADDNGGPFRDRVSTGGGDYDIDQHELTLTGSLSDNVDIRLGLFTLDALSVVRFDQKHYEDAGLNRSTLDDLRALHAVGGAPDLGATFPSGSCDDILMEQFGQTILDENQDAPVLPSPGEPHTEDNLTGWIPGYLICIDKDGLWDGIGGLHSAAWSGRQRISQEQFSVFGELSWQLSDSLSASIGLRTIDDEKPSYEFVHLSNQTVFTSRFNPFATSADITALVTGDARGECNDPAFLDDEEISFEECLWDQFYEVNDVDAPRWLQVLRNKPTVLEYGSTVFNFDLEFTPTENVFIFGRVASGYRSGGTNAIPTAADDFLPFLHFDPEELLTYEGGLKVRLPDQGLRLMTSVYYYNYENYIANAAITLCPEDPWECAGEPNINYGDVRISGLDFEFAWDVPFIENLSLFGFWAINRGEVLEPYVLPTYEWTGNEDISPDAQYTYISSSSVEGNKLPNNPRTKWNLSSEYTIPFDGGSSLALLGVYSWRGDFDAYVSNNPMEKAGTYDRVDLNVTWTAASQDWSISVFGHNVFNDQEIELFEYIDYEWEDPDTGEEVFVIVDDPFISGWRYWGAELRYRF
ncbi:MAG: TonB-dependent receptor [Gammaproteobacteria bacterium]|nr:TonB-dependent receptor [Gammaproteobacteria bacterium]